MGLLKVDNGQFGIVLEGVETLVPEQVLDVVHVRPTPQEFRGATPPEGVRGDVCHPQSGSMGTIRNYLTEGVVVQPHPLLVEE